MTKNQSIDHYYYWMYDMLCNGKEFTNVSYDKLLRYLFETDFYAKIPMDENRAADGLDLRYRYDYEQNRKTKNISQYLNNKPCSILEMMVALSIRCEEQIMDNPDIGNRTGQWFWSMIQNLGLYSLTDGHFDEDIVDESIHRLLEREYGPDGTDGLFLLKHCAYDVRHVEIWYQAMWYLDQIIEEGE